MMNSEDAKIVDGYIPYFIGMFLCGGAFVGGLLAIFTIGNIGIVGAFGGIIGMVIIFATSNDYILKQHKKRND